MLLHCVFLNVRPGTDPAHRDAVIAALGDLQSEVDGMIGYAWGPNRDYESKTPDHQHGFVCTFTDRDAHLAYERHPTHQRLGAQLVAMCVGGADGILVYDLEVADPA